MSDRALAVGIAGITESAISQREDKAAVARPMSVGHVFADEHRYTRKTGPRVEQFHVEPTAGIVLCQKGLNAAASESYGVRAFVHCRRIPYFEPERGSGSGQVIGAITPRAQACRAEAHTLETISSVFTVERLSERGTPGFHQLSRVLLRLIGRLSGLVEGRADAKAGGPGCQVGRHVLSADTPDGQ